MTKRTCEAEGNQKCRRKRTCEVGGNQKCRTKKSRTVVSEVSSYVGNPVLSESDKKYKEEV